MMSLQAIADLARDLAIQAAEGEVEPYAPGSAEECRTGWEKRIPIPNIGNFRPDDWKLIDYVTVDKTGFGYEYEPALTIRAFKEWAAERVEQDDHAGFAIIEEGQFQIVVGYFSADETVESLVDDTNGIKAEDLCIENCPDCGWAYDGDNPPDLCELCGYDLAHDGVEPLFSVDEKVTTVEPGIYDGWPPSKPWVGGECFTVADTYFTKESVIDLTDENGDTWEIPWALVTKVYNPAEDPRQPALL